MIVRAQRSLTISDGAVSAMPGGVETGRDCVPEGATGRGPDAPAGVTRAAAGSGRRYRVVPYPRQRQPVLDVLATAARQYMPTVLHRLDTKSCADIAAEITALRQRLVTRAGDLTGNRLVTVVPGVIRRLALRTAGRLPAAAARFAPPVGISSLGMFDAGGWGIPLSPMTLMVTVGGILHRPAFVDGGPQERQLLPLTLSFDHAVVDGAPAARLAATPRRLFETAAALDDTGTADHDSRSA